MDKLQKRALKLAARAQNSQLQPVIKADGAPVDCACVLHGNVYSWDYVDRLYNMLNRNITAGVRMHVYTEAGRDVPSHMVKHVLEDWGITGPRRGWWYKMQLFNSQHHNGPLLYCDLDLVIVKNIDWIWQLPLNNFWSVRDFKYLWRPSNYEINSSIMWWNTADYDWLWKKFKKENLSSVLSQFHGDQNFLNSYIADHQRRYFDTEKIKSWRWQCLDGGYDFRKKRYHKPSTGTKIDSQTGVLVFHGQPKPGELQDQLILDHWK
jgi:hypothetical protein